MGGITGANGCRMAPAIDDSLLGCLKMCGTKGFNGASIPFDNPFHHINPFFTTAGAVVGVTISFLTKVAPIFSRNGKCLARNGSYNGSMRRMQCE